MRRWAGLGTLALGIVLIGCGPQTDAPVTPITGATATVGGIGTGTPQAAGSATAAPTGSATVVSLAPTLAPSATPAGATETPPPLPTGTARVNSSPAPTGPTATGSPQVAGTTVPAPILASATPAAPNAVAIAPEQIVRDFLSSIQADPRSMSGAVFFSQDLQNRLPPGADLLALLHLPAVYQTFTVSGPGPGPTSATVRALLTYSDNAVVRDFTLRIENNRWAITGFSSPDEGDLTPGNSGGPAPGPGTALPAAPTPAGSETPPSLAPPTVEGAPTAPGTPAP